MDTLTNPVKILAELIRCPSVTPAEGGALAQLETWLKPLGFEVDRPVFKDKATPDIENLYARMGHEGPHLMFAGHTDVVPTGDVNAWSHPPFSGTVEDSLIYGRGAVDMKGGIAAFIAALARIKARGEINGSVSMLITGDEEGPAINGTVKLLEWAKNKGEKWDASIVGEPTNPNAIGDMIKIGRRGSLSGILTVHGRQGHVAYPDRADNPIRPLLGFANALLAQPLDNGTNDFQPSNLEITAIDTHNTSVNVIPEKAILRFNIRYNDCWTKESLQEEIEQRLQMAHQAINKKRDTPVIMTLEWVTSPGGVFLTKNDRLVETLNQAIKTVTGKKAELSTSGGTSDARFIKDYCPVVEFGLVGHSMHQIDEHTSIDDLEKLTLIYERFIEDFFKA